LSAPSAAVDLIIAGTAIDNLDRRARTDPVVARAAQQKVEMLDPGKPAS
jgi:hypothetical protein